MLPGMLCFGGVFEPPLHLPRTHRELSFDQRKEAVKSHLMSLGLASPTSKAKRFMVHGQAPQPQQDPPLRPPPRVRPLYGDSPPPPPSISPSPPPLKTNSQLPTLVVLTAACKKQSRFFYLLWFILFSHLIAACHFVLFSESIFSLKGFSLFRFVCVF
jgi:hypothetical protein